MEYRSVNPATETCFATYPQADPGDVECALERAVGAAGRWASAPFSERAALLRSVAEILESRVDDLAEHMSREMGKPIGQARAEIQKCAWGCRYFAEEAEGFLASRPVAVDGAGVEVRFEPLGTVLAIMPWNFPFWQVFRFAAPALMAGNVVLLKHAPNTPGCAVRIVECFEQAGAPEGVFQNLFLSNEQAAKVVQDSRVRGVSLTGSTRAGRQVASNAGAAIKKTVLELGGSDPFIVFEDADIEAAVRAGVAARCQNNGQSCIAAKRFLIHAPVWEAFVGSFVEAMARLRVGDPLASDTDLGPLARSDLRDNLHRQVTASIAAGAELLAGGAPPEGRGYFYPPTVLARVPGDAPAAREELFGPVAALFTFETEEEAVRLGNGSEYGLGASVWTRDPGRAERMARRIEAGSVFVNAVVKSDPRLPFGGVKQSGYGRELGPEGIREFVNVKTVWNERGGDGGGR